jgi:hypothetical protein
MSLTKEEITTIVKATCELIKSKDIDENLRNSTTEKGFYGQLLYKLKKAYILADAKRFQIAYNRNNWNYKDLVENYLKNNTDKIRRSENFNFTSLEWEKFLTKPFLSCKAPRQEFLTPFHDHLAHLLQERGIYKFISTTKHGSPVNERKIL